MNQNTFELQVENVKYIGSPILVEVKECLMCANHCVGNCYVNPVIAVQSNIDSPTWSFYGDLLKRIGLVMLNEERECNFLTHELCKMVQIYRKVTEKNLTKLEKLVEYFKKVTKVSSLAKMFIQTYSQLRKGSEIDLVLNNSSRVCMSLAEHQLTVFPSSTTELIRSSIRPYQSLLLCDNIDTPGFGLFLSVHSTSLSLAEISDRMGESLDRVMTMATYLLYWGRASLIFPICGFSMYKTTEKFAESTSEMHIFQNTFSRHFPKNSLHWILNTLLPAVPLFQILELFGIEVQQCVIKAMIEWLLRNDVVVQLHHYYFYFDDGGDRGPDLERVVGFLEGRDHFEEIMYRCGLGRKDLAMILHSYRDRIVVDIRVDPNYEKYKLSCL